MKSPTKTIDTLATLATAGAVICAVLALVGLAKAETLPNAPSASRARQTIVQTPNQVPGAVPAYREGKKENWTLFVMVAGVDLAASAYDSKITLDGTRSGHGCYEANPGLVGKYPNAGPLYAKNLGISGGLIFASFAMKKWLHLPVAPYAMMGVDTVKHAHGVWQWYHFKNGACL